jgi:hypothetical protein
MNECQDLDLGRRHLIEQAISLNEKLPHVGSIEFGKQAAALAMDVERGGRLECLNQETLSRWK